MTPKRIKMVIATTIYLLLSLFAMGQWVPHQRPASDAVCVFPLPAVTRDTPAPIPTHGLQFLERLLRWASVYPVRRYGYPGRRAGANAARNARHQDARYAGGGRSARHATVENRSGQLTANALIILAGIVSL